MILRKAPKTKAQILAEEEAKAKKIRKVYKAFMAKRYGGRQHRGRGRKVSMNDQDDSDDEYDGTSRSWAH